MHNDIKINILKSPNLNFYITLITYFEYPKYLILKKYDKLIFLIYKYHQILK